MCVRQAVQNASSRHFRHGKIVIFKAFQSSHPPWKTHSNKSHLQLQRSSPCLFQHHLMYFLALQNAKSPATNAGSLDSTWNIENFWMYYFARHKQIQNKNGLEYFEYSYSCHLLESHATFWNCTCWILERFST